MQDGDDRPAVALVEIDQQLHHLDLVADVEVGGRLVEDQDRRGLGERDRDEHELALTHRQAPGIAVGEVADPTRSMASSTATRSLSRVPLRGGSCGRRPSATISRTVSAKGSWTSSGTTAIARLIAFRSRPRIGSAVEADAAAARLEDAGEDAQERRLARAVRPDEGEPLACHE